MRKHDPPITARRTVRTVSGSRRHVSKTHGTHNGRTHTWPHQSDQLDRPARLPDLGSVRTVERVRGRKHKRLGARQIRIAAHMYLDGAFDLPRLPVWIVRGRCAHDNVAVSITLSAHDEDEAITNGERVLAYQHMTAIANLTAERR